MSLLLVIRYNGLLSVCHCYWVLGTTVCCQYVTVIGCSVQRSVVSMSLLLSVRFNGLLSVCHCYWVFVAMVCCQYITVIGC